MKNIEVIKKNGEREVYSAEKVIRSLRNSGANEETISSILNKLNSILYDGISTQEIFRFVFNELKKKELKVGVRYNLKQGIIDMSLGGGFLFEKFIAKVFKKIGYSVSLNRNVQGKYIEHEVDVFAKKDKVNAMIECKHFSKPWLGISIQTALYVYARFLDLKDSFNQVFLVTNTKFSPQVIKYSNGVGIKLIGWRYPGSMSLEKLIEGNKIYPITILPLSKSKLQEYFEKGILTFEDLLNVKDLSPKIRETILSLLK